MTDLLKLIAQGLVEEPEAVSVDVDEPNEEGVSRAGSPKRSARLCVPLQTAATRKSWLRSTD